KFRLTPARLGHPRFVQWRKWRTPVKTIAAPASSAAAIDSLSRTEPPGCAKAVTPAVRAFSTPSAKGKYASDASTEPLARSPARVTARATDSTRLIWPAPTPTEALSLASTIAFDFTCLTTFQAKASCSHSASVGRRALT